MESKPIAIRRLRAHMPLTGMSRSFITSLCLLVSLAAPGGPAGAAGDAAAQPAPAALSQAETIRMGERIYRDGILPSGKPLQGVVKGDLAVDGRMFSCASCHLRSGQGSSEGGITTPANSGNRLFQPSYYGRDFTPAERRGLSQHYQAPVRRPAYTETTLATALRNGLDPTGRTLDAAMPRYRLDDADLAVLTGYLRTLSAEPSPGASDTTLLFATVVTSEVPAEERAAELATLDAFAAEWNARAPDHAARARYPEIAQEADLSYRSISISRWLLEGAPATWRAQLEEHYRKEPVFALLGGISTGEWRPMHEFSEEHRIPCLLPITEFPVQSATDWYTLYFSKGLYQEGATAAQSLGRDPELAAGAAVVQLYRDTKEGRALAGGFESSWRALGRRPPVNLLLPPDGAIPADVVRQLTTKEGPAVLLVWLGKEALPVLESLLKGGQRPAALYLSATLLGQDLWSVPEQAREFTSITYPYLLQQDEAMHQSYAKSWLRGKALPVDEHRIGTRMYSLVLLLNQTLPKLRRNFYRDYLLDLVDRCALHGYPDYDSLSFGPGQRYASKECHIVTLSRGPKPILIRKND